MNEDVFYRRHVKPFLDQYGSFDRLENILGTVPDIAYSLRSAYNAHGWLELKVVKPSGDIFFEKYQLPWFQRRLRTTDRGLWILATDGFRIFLYHPRDVLKWPRVGSGKWTVVTHQPKQSHVLPEVPWPWDMVLQKLANE